PPLLFLGPISGLVGGPMGGLPPPAASAGPETAGVFLPEIGPTPTPTSLVSSVECPPGCYVEGPPCRRDPSWPRPLWKGTSRSSRRTRLPQFSWSWPTH